MNKKRQALIVLGILAVFVGLAAWYLSDRTVAVLDPAGPIASKERSLMYETILLGLIVVVPVFAMTFWISWRYREGRNTKYSPDWDHSRKLEITWWLIPSAIIAVLAVITWNSAHALDPYRALTSKTKPLTVQVVALDWKWLFIYPEQHVASVNELAIPVHTPINMQITADAPMNSLWIPQLSGQIYAMPGMSTQLHIMASKVGTYYGSSANISGTGFADMHFNTKAMDTNNFQSWIAHAKHGATLDMSSYMTLAQHNTVKNPLYFKLTDPQLYTAIVNSYMGGMNSMDMNMNMEMTQ